MSAAPARAVVVVGAVLVLAITGSVVVQRLAGAPALSLWVYAVLVAIIVAAQWVLARQKSGKH